MDADEFSFNLPPDERTRYRQLGKVVQKFAPSITNGLAGILLGCVAIGGGIYCIQHPVQVIIDSRGDLPLSAEGKQSWVSVGMTAFISFVYMGVGIGFIWWSIATLRRRIFVCEEGLWIARGRKSKIFLWNETALVREVVSHEHMPIHLIGFLFASEGRQVVIERNDGRQCGFSKNSVRDFDGIVEILQSVARDRGIHWELISM